MFSSKTLKQYNENPIGTRAKRNQPSEAKSSLHSSSCSFVATLPELLSFEPQTNNECFNKTHHDTRNPNGQSFASTFGILSSLWLRTAVPFIGEHEGKDVNQQLHAFFAILRIKIVKGKGVTLSKVFTRFLFLFPSFFSHPISHVFFLYIFRVLLSCGCVLVSLKTFFLFLNLSCFLLLSFLF